MDRLQHLENEVLRLSRLIEEIKLGAASKATLIAVGAGLTGGGRLDAQVSIGLAQSGSGAPVTLDGTQTLTNKTLTDPVLNVAGGSLVLPQSTSPSQTAEGSIGWDTDDDTLTVGTGAARKTMVSLDGTQTLTNKTLTDPVINAGGGSLVLPQAASQSLTAEGQIGWDTDDNRAYIGTGSGQVQLVDSDHALTELWCENNAFATGSFWAQSFMSAHTWGNSSTAAKVPVTAAANWQWVLNLPALPGANNDFLVNVEYSATVGGTYAAIAASQRYIQTSDTINTDIIQTFAVPGAGWLRLYYSISASPPATAGACWKLRRA